MTPLSSAGLPNEAAKLTLQAGFCSEVGARDRNEDFGAFCESPHFSAQRGAIAVVADGVGGRPGGRVAAELAVRAVIDGYFGGNALRGVRRNGAQAIAAANDWIHRVGQRDDALAGMACTLSALVLRGRMAHLLHVGDSRVYRLRDGVLEPLTVDHATGLPGYRDVLTRAIGAEPHVGIDYGALSIGPHDRFLLCTDGVHGGLSKAALREILGRQGSPDEIARVLVEAALASPRGDNATALVIDVLAVPPPNADDLAEGFARKPVLPLPRTGDSVDGFVLEALLGDGRYTRVFRARDLIEDRSVVLKFPKPSIDREAMLRQAFMRETWIAGRVRNPWVGEAIDIPAERRSGIYVAMPFYDGETLERRLSALTLSIATGLDLAQKLARGVAALHRAGIVHRDIKPDNVIVETARSKGGPGLRLVDLGVARVPEMEDFPSAHAPGTPSFMAPELFEGHAGDAASDQFALGVTLYRMFSGAYPYGEIEPFTRPRFRDPVPLGTRRPDMPAWLERTIMRAVAIEPRARYADVLELAFDLEHGANRAVPMTPGPRRPLLERNPVAFWRGAALILLALLLATLSIRLH